jgi:hypothetical protein
LPGLSELPRATNEVILAMRIKTLATQLCPVVNGVDPLQGTPADLVNLLSQSGRHRDAVLDGIFNLHCQLLEALSVADFRLGKAYGFGRALAETALVPGASKPLDAESDFRAQFKSGRLFTIKCWLFDLKSLLPPHTAYAVYKTLGTWEDWVNKGSHNPKDWSTARGAVRKQGRIWRELLSGEKSAQDLLDLPGYLVAARDVAGNVARSLARYWWLGLSAAILIVGGVGFAVYVHDVSSSVRLVSALVWLAGVVGVSLKGIGALLGGVLKDVEGWLWQSELDEAVAIKALSNPTPEAETRPPRLGVGSLTLPEVTSD